jgi:Ni2+-binding GTPase involved in maturation of urease and hydrogenase
MKIFPISAKTGEGVHSWVDWLENEAKTFLK